MDRDQDRDRDPDQERVSYPLLPSLPPLPSSRTYTFQPSAPPSAPSEHHSPPLAPPTASSPNSWHAASFYPAEPDLQPDRLFTEPSAPSFYPDLLPTENISYPHHVLASTYSNSPSGLLHQHQQEQQRYPVDEDHVTYPQLKQQDLVVGLFSDRLLSNEQLQEVYQNEFLNNMPQRLARIEHCSETPPQDAEMEAFVAKMRSYETAYEAVQQCRLALFNLERKAKGYASKLWIVQSKSEVAKALCGDGATISHTYTYQYGHHEPEIALKLQKSLNRLFKQRTKYLIRMQFEETSCKLWIHDHLSSYLRTIKAKEQSQESDLHRITEYLDILYNFERSARRQPDFDPLVVVHDTTGRTTSPGPSTPQDVAVENEADHPTNAILQSIQDWITLMAASLLHLGGLREAEYLIVQVLRSRQVSKWAINLIQCGIPTNWFNAYQEFYLTMLQLVLCGASPPTARLSRPEQGLMVTNPLGLGSTLDEDDYLAILDQMDVTIFFNQLLLEHKDMHTQNNGSLFQTDVSRRKALRLIAATRHFFDVLLDGLQRLTKFGVASRRVAQLLCQLAQIFGDHLLVLGPISFEAQYDAHSSVARQVLQIAISLDFASPQDTNRNCTLMFIEHHLLSKANWTTFFWKYSE